MEEFKKLVKQLDRAVGRLCRAEVRQARARVPSIEEERVLDAEWLRAKVGYKKARDALYDAAVAAEKGFLDLRYGTEGM